MSFENWLENRAGLSTLDFVINTLKEHEKTLDRLTQELGMIAHNLDKLFDKVNQARFKDRKPTPDRYIWKIVIDGLGNVTNVESI